MTYETIITKTYETVGLITFNRPSAMNALNSTMIKELADALMSNENNTSIGATIITGSDKAFAAGADIKEMCELSYPDVYTSNFITEWEFVTCCRKPVIAAVAGFALGGGCELAMMCDFILAAENAKFGQPEVTIGTIPGAGGTQRLTRLIGKSKAMEMCLTGRIIDADEAERAGIVSRVVPLKDLIDDAIATAKKISSMSTTAILMAKESVNVALETTLAEGVRFERRLFHATFATPDQKEGMKAFIEKRDPKYKDT